MKSITYNVYNTATGLPKPAVGSADSLHVGHFAFMRAVVQGMDARESWTRYLQDQETSATAADIRQTIRRVRDAVAVTARRHGRPGTARLVALDLSKVAEVTAQVPPLAEFIHAHDLEEFSEAEQLQFYQQHYGRNLQRLVRKEQALESRAW